MQHSSIHTLSNWRHFFKSGSCIGVARNTYFKNLVLKRRISISSSYNVNKEPLVPSDLQLASAKVIYSVAPAVGHNQESHPESNLRVPAIADALEQMKLTPKYRSSEIIELKNFKPASTEDVISVHESAYVLGLEKAMGKASEQGLIFIEGSGPTYATSSTFQDSLIAAGAGLAVVDSVVAASRYSAEPPAGFALIRGLWAFVFSETLPLQHVLDPLASLQFTTGTYYMLAASIKQLAKEVCGGRCVFFLEGGYNLKSLSYSVADSFRAFLGEASLSSEFDNPAILYEEPSTRIKEAIRKVKAIHSL